MATDQMELTNAGRPLIEAPPPRELTPMALLQIALSNGAAIDVIERLRAMEEKAHEQRAEVEFNIALNAAQGAIGRIAPNALNKETDSKWATYAKMDADIRPVYLCNGFSLSFTCDECPKAEHERIVCYVSHTGGHTRKYWKDIPADGKGPKGGGVMTKVHASGSASSYGMRYLLKMIFNVAIGEDDNDGNTALEDWLATYLERMANCKKLDSLQVVYKEAYREADDKGDSKALQMIVGAYADHKKRVHKLQQEQGNGEPANR